MRNYELTLQAEDDLLGIWRYTAKHWGKPQADRYFGTIEACFNAIGAGEVRSKNPLPAYKNLKSVRCEHHYIFFLAAKKPIIFAILHEKMDFVARLTKRLSSMESK